MTASGADLSEILATPDRLRRLTRVDIQAGWQCCRSGGEMIPAELNRRSHIAWSRQQVIELTQNIIVPTSLNNNYPIAGLTLRLVLKWWAEDARIYINDKLVQTGDLFDCSTRILLSESVRDGDQFAVRLRLVSPKHDDGALVQSVCVYERLEPETIDPGFVADELEVFLIAITQNPSYIDKRQEHLNFLAAALNKIDWLALPKVSEKFDNSLKTLRQTLADYISANLPNYNSKIALLGHAHLDLAWLWPISETWKAAENTFKSVLSLRRDFPNLIFTHSSPALYAWIETHRPELFSEIRREVQSQNWEIAAGLWVEPELNIIGAESIARQLLYGQLYTREKFGQVSPIAWLPDSFGFCWQLPQLLKQAGINYFVTQKLRWNDTTQFPHGLFNWQSPDGTEIVAYMSALIGEGIEPVKMATYAAEWEAQTGLKTALWLPGVGDHGGGPTRDMLEIAKRWEASPVFPRLSFSRAADYLSEISREVGELPVWRDELYLEFHRGCYTTHADQKRWNRRCENLLYQAELWSAAATLLTDAVYPKLEIETAWKRVLFNQFHDILPGSAVPEVYQDANQAWEEAYNAAERLLETATAAIANSVPFPPSPQPNLYPVLVWNGLNWSRAEAVEVPLNSSGCWRLYDASGKALRSQVCGEKLRFLATDVPAVGFRLFWLGRETAETLDNSSVGAEDTPLQADSFPDFTTSIPPIQNPVKLNINSGENWALENELLKVEILSQTGDIAKIWDKKNGREVLSEMGGNRLHFFEDSGQYWDGWNIDPNYNQHPLEPPRLQSISWQEKGPVRWCLRVVRVWRKSEFVQNYVLEANSPVLKIETRANWRERHVLVKAGFGLTVNADTAHCEIPAGVMERPTTPQTEREKAKWEIPAMNWVELGDENYGVSLLNDCKYGYDIRPDQIRLTLLRGSTWPDPEADVGIHHFTYAIYPHMGNWKAAKVTRRGYELNQPLRVQVLGLEDYQFSEQASETISFLDLGTDSLILMAFKQAEGNSRGWILRCYESLGEETELNFENKLGLAIANSVNLLEDPIPSPNFPKISPWKIVSVQLFNPSISELRS